MNFQKAEKEADLSSQSGLFGNNVIFWIPSPHELIPLQKIQTKILNYSFAD